MQEQFDLISLSENSDQKPSDQHSKIEKVLDVRGRGKGAEYLVKWKGSEVPKTSWVKREEVSSARGLVEQLLKQRNAEKSKTANQKNKMTSYFGQKQRKDSDSESDFTLNDSNHSNTPEHKLRPPSSHRLKNQREVVHEVTDYHTKRQAKTGGSSSHNQPLRSTHFEDVESNQSKQKSKVQGFLGVEDSEDNDSQKQISLDDTGKNNDQLNLKSDQVENVGTQNNLQLKINLGDGELLKIGNKQTGALIASETFFEKDLLDLQHATNVISYIRLKGELYFLLEWENDPELHEKNSTKYISMGDLEIHNPKLLVKFFKLHLTFLE